MPQCYHLDVGCAIGYFIFYWVRTYFKLGLKKMHINIQSPSKKRNIYYSIVPTSIIIKPIQDQDHHRTHSYKFRALKYTPLSNDQLKKLILDETRKVKFEGTGLH